MWIFKNRYFLILLGIALIVYLGIEAKGEDDLFIYFCAADDLTEGKDFYAEDYMGGFHYYYSVVFAYFLSLFKFLPFYGIKFVWLLLNLILFIHLFVLLRNSKYVHLLNEKQQELFLFFVLLFSFRFFHQNIHTSQITILILWCCIYGILSIEKGDTLKGSSILALGINIKLLPLVFLPYLLYRGYFKALIYTLGICIFLVILPSIFIGHQFNMQLLSSWYHLINPSKTQHILDTDERSFHGLSTLLATLFISNPPDPLALSIKRNIADISVEHLKLLLLIVRVALVSFTLFFLQWPPFKAAKSQFQSYMEVSYILLLIPLIFPHQQHYAFLFTVPAFALCLFSFLYRIDSFTKGERYSWIIALLLIYLTANLASLLGTFNRYYDHYKILTYGALLLIPLLVKVRLNKEVVDLGISK